MLQPGERHFLRQTDRQTDRDREGECGVRVCARVCICHHDNNKSNNSVNPIIGRFHLTDGINCLRSRAVFPKVERKNHNKKSGRQSPENDKDA